MAISPRRFGRLALLACALALAPAGRAAAEVRVGAATEVRSIRFSGVKELPEHELRALLRTRSRGSAFGLRATLGKIPFVPSPTRYPFQPRVLQEDLVRLRQRYLAAGFLDSELRYDVAYDEAKDLLDVTFVVVEGPPHRIRKAAVAAADGGGVLAVPAEEEKSWADVERSVQRLEGRRLDLRDIKQEVDRVQVWWRNRGYPRARAVGDVARDTARAEGDVRISVATGPRMRFGRVGVEGASAISEDVVRRQLAIREGDLYSDQRLREGRQFLQQIEMIRSADLSLAASDTTAGPGRAAAGDSLVPITATVLEGKERQISGQVGYITDSGLSTEARWSHLNFMGGGRTIALSATAETGLLATAQNPDTKYRGDISVLQPYVFHRRLSAIVGPFIEYRANTQDRSAEVGSNFTLIYRRRSSFSTSLDYRVAARKIYEYRLGYLIAGDVDLLTFLTQLAQGELDSLGTYVGSSLVTLSTTGSTLDNIANPTRGVLVRPTVQVTAPTAWSQDSYWRADVVAYAFVPLSRSVVFTARGSAGRLFPFGTSIPASEADASAGFLKLRDAMFTAGGAGDVRGWGNRMLGPKFPDIRVDDSGDTLRTVADGYVPLGGLSRSSFTFELRLPIPGVGPTLRSSFFLDGGRVWTDDSRFYVEHDALDQQKTFYSAGGGLDLSTPVGAIRLSLGYKLNPSIPDLVDSQALLDALTAGTSTDTLERHQGRRWQFNLAIGSSY